MPRRLRHLQDDRGRARSVGGDLLEAAQCQRHGDRSLDDLLDCLAYLGVVVATGDFPFLAQLIDSRGLESVWHEIEDHMNNVDRFDRNLAMLLDGIERGVLTDG